MALNNESKVGILVTLVLVVLAVLTWKAGNFRFSQDSYSIKVYFKNIDGVAVNSPVMLNGFEIGRVQRVGIQYSDNPRVELVLWIKGDAKIPRGTTAVIKNMGFMGEKYIGLFMPSGSPGYLQSGETIVGQEPSSFENLLQEGEKIAVNIKEISQRLNERLKVNSQAIDDVMANLSVTMKNVAAISTNVNERFDVNKGLVDEAVGHLTVSSRNLEEMSCDLKQNPWKLMYKPKQGCPKCAKSSPRAVCP